MMRDTSILEGAKRRYAQTALCSLLVILAVLPVAAEEAPPSEPSEPEVIDAAPARPSRVAVFSSITVHADERVDGDVVVVGGDAVIDGHVSGDVVVVGGSLELDGTVGGDAVGVASDVRTGSSAQIAGSLIAVIGDLDDEGATVGGEHTIVSFPFPLPTGFGRFSAIAGLIAWISAFVMALTFLFLVLVVLIAPERVEVIARDTPRSYGLGMLVGGLTHIGMVVVHVLLVITVIGIPLSMLLDLAFRFARLVGAVGILVAVGRGIGRQWGRDLTPLGALSLGFLPYALLAVVPFFFGLWGLVIGIGINVLLAIALDWPAMGVVLLTRFGSQPHGLPPAAAAPPATSREQTDPAV